MFKIVRFPSKLKPLGDVIELVLDDSKKQKRGKDMQAVGWIHDPVNGAKIRGHKYVMATIRFKGHTIPFGISLHVKQQDCPDLGLAFQKTTQLAADLIKAFTPPAGVKVRVLFDSYYLCPVLVKVCRSKKKALRMSKSDAPRLQGGASRCLKLI